MTKRPRHKGRETVARDAPRGVTEPASIRPALPPSNRCQSAFQQSTHAGLAAAFIDLLDGGVRSRVTRSQRGKVVALVGGGRCLAGEMRPSTIQRLGVRRAGVLVRASKDRPRRRQTSRSWSSTLLMRANVRASTVREAFGRALQLALYSVEALSLLGFRPWAEVGEFGQSLFTSKSHRQAVWR